jgi:protein-disulfide isomerase
MCALDQGRFWDYHDLIFANQTGENVGAYTDRRLEAFAEMLGLDLEQFNACLASGEKVELLEQEKADGDEMGVTGTPSIFVNGVKVGAGFVPGFDEIQQVIESELAGQ